MSFPVSSPESDGEFFDIPAISITDREDLFNQRLAHKIRRLNKYEEDFLTAKIQVAREEVCKAQKYLDSLLYTREQRLQVHITHTSPLPPKKGFTRTLLLVITLLFVAGSISRGGELAAWWHGNDDSQRNRLRTPNSSHPGRGGATSKMVEHALMQEAQETIERVRQQQQARTFP